MYILGIQWVVPIHWTGILDWTAKLACSARCHAPKTCTKRSKEKARVRPVPFAAIYKMSINSPAVIESSDSDQDPVGDSSDIEDIILIDSEIDLLESDQDNDDDPVSITVPHGSPLKLLCSKR